jgi:uncharacterized membrane protein
MAGRVEAASHFMMTISAKVFLTAATLLVTAIGTAEDCFANFRVCNRSEQRVDVAFGYPHPQFGWTSEGWWTIASGECRTIFQGSLTNRYYYLYATGSAGAVWQGPEGQNGGFFCIQPEKFVFSNSSFVHEGTLNCDHHNLQSRKFILIDTGGLPNHVHTLTVN